MIYPSFQFSEGIVSDELFNILHETHYKFGEAASTDIVVGGSFSLNAQKAIDRKVSDLDLCVKLSSYKEMFNFMYDRIGTWFDCVKTPGKFSDTTTFASFQLENSSAKVCLYCHNNFNEIITPILEIHGRPINLFPVKETIEYKMHYLSDSYWIDSNTTEDIEKHLSDVIQYSIRKNAGAAFNRRLSELCSVLSRNERLKDIKGIAIMATDKVDYHIDAHLLK